jgi:hypothetical protein
VGRPTHRQLSARAVLRRRVRLLNGWDAGATPRVSRPCVGGTAGRRTGTRRPGRRA